MNTSCPKCGLPLHIMPAVDRRQPSSQPGLGRAELAGATGKISYARCANDHCWKRRVQATEEPWECDPECNGERPPGA